MIDLNNENTIYDFENNVDIIIDFRDILLSTKDKMLFGDDRALGGDYNILKTYFE